MATDNALEFITASDDSLANAMILEMVPNQLIRVQLRRIRRQKEQPQLAVGLANKIENLARSVRRMAVNDQKHRTLGIVQKPLEEFDELASIHLSFNSHKTHIVARTDRRNHVHAIALARRLNNRCLTLDFIDLSSVQKISCVFHGRIEYQKMGSNLRAAV